ncbi:L-fucose kinase-like [Oppia nitens]|uniref:L-fucose kinase-like n=1 Tax=Oppia nitens TaxID=1686743 RepID=UPI0023DCA2CD|nr:L-fucose kinase-like [Oppia nitens]
MDVKLPAPIIISQDNFHNIINKNCLTINEYFQNVISNGRQTDLITIFDNYLADLLNQNSRNNDILLARILCLISQFNQLSHKLDINYKNPVNNNNKDNDLKVIIKYFECEENFRSGLKCLIQLRDSYPIGDCFISECYDRCVSALIKKSVKTGFDSILPLISNSDREIPVNQWVTAVCPARIDLFGGWTDTPPICYEIGGQVMNIAIQVNHKKPIGCRARKVENISTDLITIREFDSNKQLVSDLKLNNIEEFIDYCEPDSSGALIKSALICCQFVDLNNQTTLHQQLNANLISGLEIELWSDLPQGSGLGTSSILLSCVIAVLWMVSGKQFTKSALINAVLYTEQLLTTCGGWQDQIGGVIGGVKLGRSEAALPLKISYKKVEISKPFQSLLEKHLLLIYSGTVRLAKNLLHTVIQNWYIRDLKITDCFNNLLTNTRLCLDAFQREDLQSIGELLTKYWQMKKILATNSEPKSVSKFFNRTEPFIHGGALCGAGGGGFICVIVKQESYKQEVMSIAGQCLTTESQLYECCVDETGIEITIDNQLYNLQD